MNHTVFGLYAKFLSNSLRNSAIEQMRGDSIANLKRKLGIIRSGVGAAHPLKGCLQCLAEAQVTENSWWRLSHQWPTVSLCNVHQIPLFQVSSKLQVKELRTWLLPEDIPAVAWLGPPAISDRELETLGKIAKFTSDLVAYPGFLIEAPVLRIAYLLGAKRLDLLARTGGALRYRDLLVALRSRYLPLANTQGWRFLSSLTGESGGFAAEVLRASNSNFHPSKHLAILAFLFHDFDDFVTTYRRAETIAVENGNPRKYVAFNETRQLALNLVATGLMNISKVARQTGVQRCVIRQWLRSTDQEAAPTPHAKLAEVRTKLDRMLSSGALRETILNQLQLNSTFLRRYLKRNPALDAVWREQSKRNLQLRYRRQFLSLMHDQFGGGLSMRQVFRKPGSGYSWLLKHDRAWLLATVRAIQNGKAPLDLS